ncbi:MAG: intein-containing Rv2578c family radical SAM protein, partial [Solirubrobacteraceae bacterium]
AEGGRSTFALRISNTDPEILGWTERCARGLGFDVCRDAPNRVSGAVSVQVRGGLAAHLRFFHLTDPVIRRKRSIDGQVVETFTDLRVVAVEPLGRELPMYDITTSTGDFIADGVVSHNCFARPTHTYLDLDAGRDFEREIVVKINAPERLRVELRRPSWKGEHVALGTNTDPYQWVEGRYKLMRGIWEAMIEARNPGSVLTKSPLLLRDLDLMLELSRRAEFSAALSVPTIEERAWRSTEPHTPSPRARLEAVATLTAAGIRTGVLVAPLMPGINDDPEQVREILRLCTEAGAAYVTGIALHLRREVRQVFMEWLRRERPELVDRYRALYRRGAYAPPGERRRLAALLDHPDRPTDDGWGRGGPRESPPRPPPATGSASGQERLFDLC